MRSYRQINRKHIVLDILLTYLDYFPASLVLIYNIMYDLHIFSKHLIANLTVLTKTKIRMLFDFVETEEQCRDNMCKNDYIF